MKIREIAKNAATKAASAYREIGIASVVAFPMLASASTDPFADAVADATTKIGTYGAALVGLAAVGVVFSIAMKYVKRIPRAS